MRTVSSSSVLTSTVVVGAGGEVAGVPEAREVVVATGADDETLVVVVTVGVAVVGGTAARSDTSVCRSRTSSRNWMISARSVSISSAFDSRRPQPAPTSVRATIRARMVTGVRICMGAVFQRIGLKTSHLTKFLSRTQPKDPTCGSCRWPQTSSGSVRACTSDGPSWAKGTARMSAPIDFVTARPSSSSPGSSTLCQACGPSRGGKGSGDGSSGSPPTSAGPSVSLKMLPLFSSVLVPVSDLRVTPSRSLAIPGVNPLRTEGNTYRIPLPHRPLRGGSLRERHS